MVDLSQGGTIDMIKRDTISDILYELRDGKCHTYAELADAAEVSLTTVRRCIESLSYHHPIVIFQGQRSDGKRGVELEIFIDPALGGFTSSEIAIIIIALLFLSDITNKYGQVVCDFLIDKVIRKWKKDEAALDEIKMLKNY
jgi:predicted DNA-binding transcriptional regulator YafY